VSLSILSPLPDPNKKLRELESENFRLREQLEEKETELRKERLKTATMERGVGELRTVLTPLYQGLAHIFGEIEVMGVNATTTAAAGGPDPRKAAIWADWKQKFPGHPAKAIDALLLHGSMTQGQLRIAVGCATGTISNVVSILNRAGLINKNGGRISLKEL
jgi:hypothetical protein